MDQNTGILNSSKIGSIMKKLFNIKNASTTFGSVQWFLIYFVNCPKHPVFVGYFCNLFVQSRDELEQMKSLLSNPKQ